MRMLPIEAELPEEPVGPETPIRSWARLRVLYTMIFPEDERARNEALCTMAADSMGRYQADPKSLVEQGLAAQGLTLQDIEDIYGDPNEVVAFINDVAQKTLTETATGLFMPHGGFSSVAHAKGVSHVLKKAEIKLQELSFAGLVIRTVHRIKMHALDKTSGSASLNKAFWLLERYDHGLICNPKSKSKMREIWDSYVNVAHLGAAMLHLYERKNRNMESCVAIIKQMDLLYSIARFYQSFGLSHEATNTKDRPTLLNGKTIWHVPDGPVAIESDLAAPLPLGAQTLLLAYQAPKSVF